MYKKLQKGKKYLLEKRGGEGERNGAQRDDKRATTVTKLAKGNSPSLPITCGRWLWIKSTGWAERRRCVPRDGLRHHRSAGNEA